MSGLIESASAILSQSEKRLEIIAQNVANAATPGYKRLVAFSALVPAANGGDSVDTVVTPAVDRRPGKAVVTGVPFDFALTGPGLFALRGDQGTHLTRQGRFSRDRDGRLIDVVGNALQLVSGNDLIVSSSEFEVHSDGTVIEHGAVLGRIAVYGAQGEEGAGDLIAAPNLQQGAYEGSNVSSADELVAMMEALRRAESAQRVMITYDELMGRAITTFGEAGR